MLEPCLLQPCFHVAGLGNPCGQASSQSKHRGFGRFEPPGFPCRTLDQGNQLAENRRLAEMLNQDFLPLWIRSQRMGPKPLPLHRRCSSCHDPAWLLYSRIKTSGAISDAFFAGRLAPLLQVAAEKGWPLKITPCTLYPHAAPHDAIHKPEISRNPLQSRRTPRSPRNPPPSTIPLLPLSVATLGTPPRSPNPFVALLGWHYLSNATCLVRPHLLFTALFV